MTDDSYWLRKLRAQAKSVKAIHVPISYPKPAFGWEKIRPQWIDPERFEPSDIEIHTHGPIIVDSRTHEILDGNHRYWKARLSGEPTISAKIVDGAWLIRYRER